MQVTPQPQDSFVAINAMTLHQAALAYAAMGFKVFPLQPGSKLPMQGWPWKKMATSDFHTINDWWTRWPTANIGLAMGAPSNADALDIDVKKGADGVRSYQAITQEPFLGPVQQTPTGGQHLILGHTPGLKNFTHKGELGGLDYRTTGGYIVGAPSRTADGLYRWVQDGPIAPPHPLVLDAITRWSTQSNTQTIEAPDIPENLPDYHQLGLAQKYLNYLDLGDTSAWGTDESAAVYAVAGALQRRLQDEGLVLGIMASNPYAWSCAERHRPFGNVGEWLWKYGISGMVAKATKLDPGEVFSPVPGGVVYQAPEDPGVEVEPEAPPPAFFVRGDQGIQTARLTPNWIVQGLIEAGQVGLLYGDSQALKSYLTLDLSVAVTRGPDWHGHRVLQPGPVWFLAGEGNAIMWRRLELLRQQKGYEARDLEDLYLSNSGLNLMNPEHLVFLKAQLEACGNRPPRLLVIDTLATNAILDENNARDVSQMIQICHSIAREWGTTVIIVHHAAKGNSKTARGSSALQNNTDFRMRLERVPGRRILTQLFVEKLKGAPEPAAPLVFEGKVSVIMGILDDDCQVVKDLTLTRLQGGAEDEIETSRARAKLTKQQADMYDDIKHVMESWWRDGKVRPGTGMLRDELYQRVTTRRGGGLKKDYFNRWVNKLLATGMLEREDAGEHEIVFLRFYSEGGAE